MHAAIYVRVSTDQQAEKGYSLATQLEACRKCANELGAARITEYVDDGYSAEFIERPGLAQLRQAVKAKQFDAVIFYDPDRMARNLLHQLIIAEEIDKSGAQLKFVIVNYDHSPDGRFMFGIRGLLAQLEKEKIKERTMRGKRGKAAKGMVISDTKPFGYCYDADNSTYIIDKQEAEIVNMIFDFLVIHKLGTARICKELNARGIPSPRAKKGWIVSSIYRILTNSLYKGVIYSMKYRYEKIGLQRKKRSLRPEAEWIPVYVPAIIDEARWQAAQKQLQANKALAKRNQKREYVLQGLVCCARCGRAMVIAQSGCRERNSYYACLSQKSAAYRYANQQPCTARQIPVQLLDEHVFTYLLQCYYNPEKLIEQIQAVVARHEPAETKQAALVQMLAVENDLCKQRDTVLRWFRHRMMPEDEAEKQLQDISCQLADIEQLKQAYKAELAATSPALSLDEIAAAIEENLTWHKLAVEEKRAAVQAVVEKVVVEREDNTRGRGSCPHISVQLIVK